MSDAIRTPQPMCAKSENSVFTDAAISILLFTYGYGDGKQKIFSLSSRASDAESGFDERHKSKQK